MKTTYLKLAGALALAFALGSVANADPLIQGQIEIDAFASTATVNFTTHSVSFNGTIPGQNSIVSYALGDYASLLGAAANYSNFQYQPLTPQVLWTISLTPSTYYTLNAISLVEELGTRGLTLYGTGTAYMAGHQATFGDWTFSSTRNAGDQVFNFSSSTTTVPDGGTTALLLGVGMLGMAVVPRRKK